MNVEQRARQAADAVRRAAEDADVERLLSEVVTPRGRRWVPIAAVAAAVAVAVTVAVVTSLSGSVVIDPAPDPASPPAPGPSTPVTPSPRGTASPDGGATAPGVGTVRDVGHGRPAAFSPDGRAVLVRHEDPGSDVTGCEGAPPFELWRIDISSGEERRAIPQEPGLVAAWARVSPDGGSIAVIDACEGFFQALRVGALAPDGRVTELREITVLEEERSPRPSSFRWTPDGQALTALFHSIELGGGRLVRIGLDGDQQHLGTVPDAAVDAAPLPDSRIVSAVSDYDEAAEDPVAYVTIQGADGTTHARVDDARAFALDPSGRLAAYGSAGLYAHAGGDRFERVLDRPVIEAAWVPEHDALVASVGPSTGDAVELVHVPLDGAPTTLHGEIDGWWLAVSPDGRRVAVTLHEHDRASDLGPSVAVIDLA